MSFEAILRQIRSHDTVILHRHKNPDSDALGSQIGLKRLIEHNFPEKKVYAVGDAAGRFSFMDGSTMDEITDEIYAGALAIVLDCGAAHLISDDRYQKAAATARFDHHIFTGKLAGEEVVDTSYESCAGLIAEFALRNGLTFSKEAAKALYTGMVTDSGRFRYDSTNANTFRIASELMKTGFDLNEVYAGLYADDFAYVRLRAQFTLKIKFTDVGVGYIYTTKEELPSYGVDTFTISRGMVSTMADLRGVDVWVNFTEDGDKVLAEIRSSKYNVNPIAVKYGGGGHAKASGAALADKAEAMAMLADLDKLVKGEEI